MTYHSYSRCLLLNTVAIPVSRSKHFAQVMSVLFVIKYNGDDLSVIMKMNDVLVVVVNA